MKPPCLTPGCERDGNAARGLCWGCYVAARRAGTLPPLGDRPAPVAASSHEADVAWWHAEQRLLGAYAGTAPKGEQSAREPWRDDAVCVGEPGLFFGPAGEQPPERAVREAQAVAVCATCPAIQPCRAAGRAGREAGVWGGETEEQRAAAGFGPPWSTVRRAQHEEAQR